MQGIETDTTAVWCECATCGEQIATIAPKCPHCGAPNINIDGQSDYLSEKNYVIAVSLCGIFGVLGLQHFYLGNYLHGLFDLLLLVGSVAAWTAASITSEDGFLWLAFVLILTDSLHTAIVFYRLITGKQRDGHGCLVKHRRT